MDIRRLVVFPFALAAWVVKAACFYSLCKRKPVLSERLSDVPVTIVEALPLIAAYISKHGKAWKIPLISEIEECTRTKSHLFHEHVWALDGSRLLRSFRPSDGSTSSTFEYFTGPDPALEGAGRSPVRCHVYLVRHEYHR